MMSASTNHSANTLRAFTDDQRREFWASLALRHTQGLGLRTARKLLGVYASPYAAVMDAANWRTVGISKKIIQAFESEQWRTTAREEWNEAGSGGYRILLWTDPRYPRRLKEISDPPLFMYYAGNAELLSAPGVGVVGARNCSSDGIATTRELCRRLSVSGVTTISGMAKGIDREAHLAALSGWGSTIAVLGTGPDTIYPAEHRELHSRISESGLVLTEFAPGIKPEARNFPLRNRIISGLSLGVLVVEAARRSGSLITAQHALDQGREVLAVPGRTQALTSTGCHDLIRQGAKAVFCCDDVLVEIGPLIANSASEYGLDPDSVKLSLAGDTAHSYAEEETGFSAVIAPVVQSDADEGDVSAFFEHDSKAIDTTARKANDAVLCEQQNGNGEAESNTALDVTADELEALQLLWREDSCHIDEISRSLGWQAARTSSVMIMLEIKGHSKQMPGMYYTAVAPAAV